MRDERESDRTRTGMSSRAWDAPDELSSDDEALDDADHTGVAGEDLNATRPGDPVTPAPMAHEEEPAITRAEGPMVESGKVPIATAYIGEIGGYRLIERLGAGGMGTVYSAVDAEGTRVALKRIHPHVAEDPSARERLTREVSLLHRVRTAGVSRVLDAEVEAEDAFIVTELIDGPTLEDDVRMHGPFAADELSGLAHGLADALRAIHATGVVHRDLKPSNVMLSVNGPVLIDFGIAQVVDDARLTQTGLVTGTPGYVDPELIAGAEPGPEHDWWSWAAVLLYAASGHAPFGSGTMAAVLARVTTGRVNTEGAPDVVGEALAAALQPDPAGRLDMADVLRVIDGHWGAEELQHATSQLLVQSPDVTRTMGTGSTSVLSQAAEADGDDTRHTPVAPATMPPSFPPARAAGAGSSGATSVQHAPHPGGPAAQQEYYRAQSPRPDDQVHNGAQHGPRHGQQHGQQPSGGQPPQSQGAPWHTAQRPGQQTYGQPPTYGQQSSGYPQPSGAHPAPPGHGPSPAYGDSRPASSGSVTAGQYGAQVQPGGDPQGQLDTWPPPHLRQPPRRTGLVLLVGLLLSPLAAIMPGTAIVLAVVAMALLGAVGSNGRARRRWWGSRPPRSSDTARALARAPWDLVLSVLHLVLGAVLGLIVGILAFYVAEGLTSNLQYSREWTAWAAAGGAIAVCWLTPTSYPQRAGARMLLKPRPVRLIAVLGALVVGVVTVFSIVGGTSPVTWAPLPQPPPLSELGTTLLGL